MILLEKQLEKYQPYNEQEEKDLMVIQKLLAQESDIFERSCLFAHMTASAWVVNREKTKVLMAYHKIYDSWAWLGGHADGERDLLKVAVKEVKEESGVVHVRPILDNPFCDLSIRGRRDGSIAEKRRREQRRSMVWVKRSSGSLYRTLVPEAGLWETQ